MGGDHRNARESLCPDHPTNQLLRLLFVLIVHVQPAGEVFRDQPRPRKACQHILPR